MSNDEHTRPPSAWLFRIWSPIQIVGRPRSTSGSFLASTALCVALCHRPPSFAAFSATVAIYASMRSSVLLAAACSLASTSLAAPHVDRAVALSPYAPVPGACPATPLNRAGDSISPKEKAYVSARRKQSNPALAKWIKSVDSCFDVSDLDCLPVVGLTASGGGYRALLNGAGVVQGFDGRDSNFKTSGLFQGLTYIAGLSGGGWLLSSIAGNNWPTVSNLYNTLWAQAFSQSLLLPAETPVDQTLLVDDLAAKGAAGYPLTIVDPWGRLLSYQLLKGYDGGVATELSGLADLSNFTAHNVPFPIWTATGVATFDNECAPELNSTQYEFSPYEFGSWDAGIKAFTQSKYIGTTQVNNKPTGSCITKYDNQGFILGTSSNIWAEICAEFAPSNLTLEGELELLISEAKTDASTDNYAKYVNPWYKSPGSPYIASQPVLNLADGGLSDQNNPIWPFIQPERDVSVLIVSDNSADTSTNLPDGLEIHQTYNQAVAHGLTKMPYVPTNTTILAEGLNTHATIFGCHDPSKITLIWMPNVPYNGAPSNTSTEQLQYSRQESAEIIKNGNNIATQNGDADWPLCLACAIMEKKAKTLPDGCTACLKKYCYN